MSHQFPPAIIEDIDGTDTRVEIVSIPPATPDGCSTLVQLATFSATLREAPVFLEPGAARALARALDEAADEADLRTLEELAR